MTTQFPFLTQLVIKDSEGRLTTSVYRKSTHTTLNQFNAVLSSAYRIDRN